MTENKQRGVHLIEDKYDWDVLTLEKFIEEGNTPYFWSDFFLQEDIKREIKKISSQLEEGARYLKADREAVDSKDETYVILPPIHKVFRAFCVPLQDISVVILGQDPYPNSKHAMGIAFSVQGLGAKEPLPASMKNILTEIRQEGYTPSVHTERGDLTHWVKQGVFLLNTALTVRGSEPGSHAHVWKHFSKSLISYISENTTGVAWILMGRKAIDNAAYITRAPKERTGDPAGSAPPYALPYLTQAPKGCFASGAPLSRTLLRSTGEHGRASRIFCSSHPSPLGARKPCGEHPAFLGSGIFRQANNFLEEAGKEKISW